ncbi:hypothetical protein [Kordia sp.]|uniref:hypothetical protein n=1 Tax=Kordia sp. TaxID=1965332 RepID=UPI0025BFB91C|nr:hypothetical protein [Kordia sp.]MCH2195854.1 hypothetical protein [Kordia sp.]
MIRFKNVFELYEYKESHRILVLKKYPEDSLDKVTETLIFSAVFYIQIPISINNFEIRFGKDIDKNYINAQNKNFYFYWDLQKIFVIDTDDGNKYYIGAGNLKYEKIEANGEKIVINYS